MHEISTQDREHLIRDKYHGDAGADLTDDVKRLAAGEPLAYVIGWIPFLDLAIGLDSESGAENVRPLIPRPETEWWTEKLIEHLEYRFGTSEQPFRLLDLCAGSGAIGLAILSRFPHARVSFSELNSAHTELIRKNLKRNNLDESRADIRTSDLFENFKNEYFDIVATNPPYIPDSRKLDDSVAQYEPREALFGGPDGMTIMKKILKDAPKHLNRDGELWMECDIENIHQAETLARAAGADESAIHLDLYGRPRLLVARFA
jgi:release factor glutamine methyltransferase